MSAHQVLGEEASVWRGRELNSCLLTPGQLASILVIVIKIIQLEKVTRNIYTYLIKATFGCIVSLLHGVLSVG